MLRLCMDLQCYGCLMDKEDCCWTLIIVDYLNLNSSNSLHLHKAPLSCFSVCTHCSSACFTRYLRQSLSDMIKRWSWFTQHSLPAVSSLLRSSNAFIFPSQEVIYCQTHSSTHPQNTHWCIPTEPRICIFPSFLPSFFFCHSVDLCVLWATLHQRVCNQGYFYTVWPFCGPQEYLFFHRLFVHMLRLIVCRCFCLFFFCLFPHELLWLDVEKTCISWTLIIFKCIFLA